eukprot:CAMPEP_0196667266 /NCGR_PEP_ID=MMETSP1086-20130531/64986_1 /TAXON_ID=77921 /ORGANISM="Cyanoptyche  gloeocystis , Strain SAG4.97" /LENGTH=85 /DNA_ID=CAMNT_0042004577 /DNA_START=1 /DNA_END=258 /DNA_ORIENTATION=-
MLLWLSGEVSDIVGVVGEESISADRLWKLLKATSDKPRCSLQYYNKTGWHQGGILTNLYSSNHELTCRKVARNELQVLYLKIASM